MINVDILGTEYKVSLNKIKELDRLQCDGFCDQYSKEISIRPQKSIMLEDEESTDFEKMIRQNSVTMHELIHAHLFEAGLRLYSEDETLIEALTVLIPKITEAHNNLITKIREEDE